MPVGVRRYQRLVPTMFWAAFTQVDAPIADEHLGIDYLAALRAQAAGDLVQKVLADRLSGLAGQLVFPFRT